MSFKRTVEIDGLNKAETNSAVLYSDNEVGCDEDDIEVWIPKSLMKEWPEKGKIGTFEMVEWIAIKKGLV